MLIALVPSVAKQDVAYWLNLAAFVALVVLVWFAGAGLPWGWRFIVAASCALSARLLALATTDLSELAFACAAVLLVIAVRRARW